MRGFSPRLLFVVMSSIAVSAPLVAGDFRETLARFEDAPGDERQQAMDALASNDTPFVDGSEVTFLAMLRWKGYDVRAEFHPVGHTPHSWKHSIPDMLIGFFSD